MPRAGMYNADGTVRLVKPLVYYAHRNICLRGHKRDAPGAVYTDKHGRRHCNVCKSLLGRTRYRKTYAERRAAGEKTARERRMAGLSTSKMTKYVDALPRAKQEAPRWRPSTFAPEPNTTPCTGRRVDQRYDYAAVSEGPVDDGGDGGDD